MLISVGTTLFVTLAVATAPATTAPVTPGHSPTEDAADPLGARRDDVGMDQAWVSPTALTQPARTITMHDHELLVVGATWAPIERLQLSVAGMSLGPSLNALIVSAKVRVLDLGRFHLAILGGGLFDFFPHTTGQHLMAGAVASVCLNANCGALVSAFGTAGPYERTGSMDDGGGASGTRRLFGGNALLPLSPHLKLVLEVNVEGLGNCSIYCTSQSVGTVASIAGLRYHTGRLAVMLGLAVVAEAQLSSPPASQTSYALSPFPVGSVNYRFGGP